MRVFLRVMLAVVVAVGAACSDPHEGAGPLQAEMVKLERELEGLRESAARLDRGEPVFPATDVLITINESFVRGLIAAQLPTIAIPVRVQQDIEIPGITEGPVRLDSARLPLKISVSRVLAAEQRLWVSLRVDIGQVGTVAR